MKCIMKNVEPYDGVMKAVHYDVINRPCCIAYLRKGDCAVIPFLPDWDDDFHRLRTSPVRHFFYSDDGKQIVIETKNTVYTLEAVE